MNHPRQRIDTLLASLTACRTADVPQLRRRILRLKRTPKASDEQFAEIQAALEASRKKVGECLDRFPKLEPDPNLPVNQAREDIKKLLAENQALIVCGETGSGKTTQLPQILLESGIGARGLIGHTQPRRIAARSVATRIAAELRTPPGQIVGYKTRFQDRTSPNSLIKVMTDGILLAETTGDPWLNDYEAIIIDEAHERSLNIDFLLGFLRQLMERRRDLKLIVTSATLNAQAFATHFSAPVIEVSGRMYPVEVRYRPLQVDEDTREVSLDDAIVEAVDELAEEGPGDVLVFLPGEREIRVAAEVLRRHHPPSSEILPLYARQSSAEQDRVFKPSGARRVVLATNVAETSLTVPGIRYVVDTGLARISRYSYRSKVGQLLVERVSRASANQRAGRCGRVASGVCIRLFSEDDFGIRPEYTDPEILRSSLAAVILRMKSLKLGAVEDFPFIDPPPPKAVSDGYQLLGELQALDDEGNLTAIGCDLARLPLDPRVGRMILAARDLACVKEVLVIASALEVQDPRLRPAEARPAADQAHAPFSDERSDFLAWLKLWDWFQEALAHKKSSRKLLDLCKKHFLSLQRLKEWRDVHGQLSAQLGEMGLSENTIPASFQAIHQALACGLLGNIGMKTEDGDYVGARGIRFAINPGSALRKKSPKWIMAGEITETSRLFARTVAGIEPEWLEPLAGHLLRRSYHDPHWSKDNATVAAYERVTLYGLPLVARRRINYGPIEPKLAREIFIREALAGGNYQTRAAFFDHNSRLIAEVAELEHKSRRQDVLVDDQGLYAFFDQRLPADVFDGASFERWRKKVEKEDPRRLFLSRDDLMRHDAAEITGDLFPTHWDTPGGKLELSYRFEPGHPLDGVTLTLPLHRLHEVEATAFEWLVPGLIREKITLLMKSLPKEQRHQLIPLPGAVTAFLESEHAKGESLCKALSRFLCQRCRHPVTADELAAVELPEHLRMNFRVAAEKGDELASGRDLEALRQSLAPALRRDLAQEAAGIEKQNLTRWDFGDLPNSMEVVRGGRRWTGYPALVDDAGRVDLKVLESREAQEKEHRRGTARLLTLVLSEHFRDLARRIQRNLTVMSLEGGHDQLLLAVAMACLGEAPLRGQAEFEQAVLACRKQVGETAQRYLALAENIAGKRQTVRKLLGLEGGAPAADAAATKDMEEQLAELLSPGFLAETPLDRLQHFPRYLDAMRLRCEKWPKATARDRENQATIRSFRQRWTSRRDDPRFTEFRWLIEELRVSLFAQELKTPFPVSEKRLEKRWGELVVG